MFLEDYQIISKSSVRKVGLLKENPIGYILSAMMAGAFVGIGVLLSFSIGSQLHNSDFAVFEKIMMGASFAIALSLVVFAGSELFTGNTMTAFIGITRKEISVKDGILLLVVSYIGNFLGAIVLALLFLGTGILDGAVGEYMTNSYYTKTSGEWYTLFFKGILCNMLVCLAVWSCTRTKSDSAKLILIFWCILAFVVTGFEHCVANMTLFSLPLFHNPSDIDIRGMWYNLLFVTAGNIVGGMLFVGLPYFFISREKNKD